MSQTRLRSVFVDPYNIPRDKYDYPQDGATNTNENRHFSSTNSKLVIDYTLNIYKNDVLPPQPRVLRMLSAAATAR